MNRWTVKGVLSDGEKLTMKKMVPVHNASRYKVTESNHKASHSRLGNLVTRPSLRRDHRSKRSICLLRVIAEIWGASDPADLAQRLRDWLLFAELPRPLGERRGAWIHLGNIRVLEASNR